MCGHANRVEDEACVYCKTERRSESTSSSYLSQRFEELRTNLSQKKKKKKIKSSKDGLQRPKQTWNDLTSLPISQSSRWSVEKLEAERLKRDSRVSDPVLSVPSTITQQQPSTSTSISHPSLRAKYIRRCRKCVDNGRSGLVLKPETDALEGDSSKKDTRLGVYSEKETLACSYVPMIRLVQPDDSDDFLDITLKNPCVYESSPILGEVKVTLERLSDVASKRLPVDIDNQIELPDDTLTIGSGETSTTRVMTRSRKNSSADISTSQTSTSSRKIRLLNRDKSKKAVAFRMTCESKVPDVIYKGENMKVDVNILILL